MDAGLEPGAAIGHIRQVSPSSDRIDLGRLGEAIAAEFLEVRGATVDHRNVTTASGEVDLVARVGGERVAVEVRSARTGETAPHLMSWKKERQVRRVAASLRPPILRVDLVTVLFDPVGIRVRWYRRV